MRLYDTEIRVLLDQLVPARTVTCHRPSDPWFGHECRAVKCETRRLEHAVRRTDPGDATAVAAAKAAWIAQRRAYIILRRQKCEKFLARQKSTVKAGIHINCGDLWTLCCTAVAISASVQWRLTDWSSNRSAAVRAERHRTIGLLQAEVRPCDAARPGAALAEDETAD